MRELLLEALDFIVAVIKEEQKDGMVHTNKLPAPYVIEGKIRRTLAEIDQNQKYTELLAASKKALEFMESVETGEWADGGAETLPEVEQFRQLIKGA